MSDVIGARPLPCLVCGVQPESVFGEQEPRYQPYGATMFDAGPGHYGSTVWDSANCGSSLAINVCDDCLVDRQHRVAVVRTVASPPKVTLRAWDLNPGDWS